MFLEEAERDVDQDAADEGGEDGHSRVLVGVDSLEVSWPVDGDVSVDRHADDDVDGAGHEGVDDGHFEMSFVECNGECPPV